MRGVVEKISINRITQSFSLLLFLMISTLGAQDNRQDISARKRIESARIRQENSINKMVRKGYKRIINTENGEYSELVGEGSEGQPRYYITSNLGAGKTIQADKLNVNTPPNLSKYGSITGKNIKIGMWDSGSPRLTHTLLTGRITFDEQSSFVFRHPTHMAGTMVGTTTCPNPETSLNCRNAQKARGIAYGSTISAYDWKTDVVEMTSNAYVDGNDNDNGDKLLVANNSYGYNPDYLKNYEFGKYGKIAYDWDLIMCGAPYFQIVKSAGNARDDNPKVVPQVTAKNGYDLLEGAGVAKNVLVVGAIKAKTEDNKITLNKQKQETQQDLPCLNRYEFISEEKCPTVEDFKQAWDKVYGEGTSGNLSNLKIDGKSIVFDCYNYIIKGNGKGLLGFASRLKSIETDATRIETGAFKGNSVLVFNNLKNTIDSSIFDEYSRIKEIRIVGNSDNVSIPNDWLSNLKNINLIDFSKITSLGSNVFPSKKSFTLILPNTIIENQNLNRSDITILPSDSQEEYWNYSFYDESSLRTDFSSWGGTDDGRIKPDLVAQGVDVFSSIESTDDSYALYSGTSSAAASVSAGIALLQEYHKNITQKYMKSSTVRALLVHSVDEIGRKGPDYRHGYGIVNLEKAADIIHESKRSTMIVEGNVAFQDSVQIMVAVKGEQIINEQNIKENFIAT